MPSVTHAGQPPGERRLSRPPSDRYRAPDPEAKGAARGAGGRQSAGRALALGVGVALAVATALTVAGGILLITAGLLAVAGIGGWLVGGAVRTGAGGTVPAPRRVALSVGLALAGVALGQLGLWAYGQLEGGALGPLEYLAEVFGFLVPLELGLAAVAAWVAAR
jgi:hypothetical protein